MKILIDIGHPAHVHYYRNLAKKLTDKGHQIFWTTKKLPTAIYLLKTYGFRFMILPKKKDWLVNKILIQVVYDMILTVYCIWNRIDLAIGTSITIAHVSKFTRVTSIIFDDDDDDVQPLVRKYVHPFASALLSPDCLKGKRQRVDTIYYPGYHELAYLHPNCFVSDKSVLKEVGLTEGESFFILRFNSFKAHHDVGIKGLSLKQKIKLIEILEPYGRILITTEREIESELKQYQMKIQPEKIHSLLSYSKLYIGDSQTMTSEAAILGVPSLRCNSFAGRISGLEELEKKYGLTYAFLPDQFDLMINKLQEMVSTPDIKLEWQLKQQKMLMDKIDVTTFWFWFIDNYNSSIKENKFDLEFFNQFR